MMAVMQCCKDITWESLAPAYRNSNFFKIGVDVIKEHSLNGSKTTITLAKNKIDNINVLNKISDGFDKKAMEYFPKKYKSGFM